MNKHTKKLNGRDFLLSSDSPRFSYIYFKSKLNAIDEQVTGAD